MVAWTIQTVSAYERLIAKGVLLPQSKFIDKDNLLYYRWMTRCMREKEIPERGQVPLWAWYHYSGKNSPRPNLRHSWLLPKGTAGTRIEFNVDSKEVLLSQFEMWCWVLGGRGYLPKNTSDLRRAERMQAKGELDNGSVEESWKRMFDLAFGSVSFWHGRIEERSIQACVPSLKLEQVRKVDFFTAR